MKGDKTCCICGKKFSGWGNNPWPVDKREFAVCCDSCNDTKVIPARISLQMAMKNSCKKGE